MSSRSSASFEKFCQVTSLHGWKFLSSRQSSKPLKIGWVTVVLASIAVSVFFLMHSIMNFVASTVQTTQDASRVSLENVYFPSVTLCNINQGRSSLFRQFGLGKNETLLNAVLKQAYFGTGQEVEEIESIRAIFGAEDVVKKGILADTMFIVTPFRKKAYEAAKLTDWRAHQNETYVRDAGWYFKTQAVQEIGENVVLRASYQRIEKDIETFTSLLPFFGTDYGLCTLIKPQITFNSSLEVVPFNDLIQNYSREISPGIRLGKENGLSFLVDSEVYDYGFSPQRGEGFKLAIHHHMDQPIMALSDVDISPGFVTQVSITPTLTVTTDEARKRFKPEERGCYFDEEFKFKYLPEKMYRYGLSNCLFEATYVTILSQCKCVPFFHTIAFRDYPRICSGKSLRCMNDILSDIGSHTHVPDANGVIRPCFSPCRDQSNKLAVTTSVFPNQNTFSSSTSGEFCATLRKIRSTCLTGKQITLNERYPGICDLVSKYGSGLCEKKEDIPGITGGFRLQNPNFSIRNSPHERSELTKVLYRYARENLALVNVYIKDPSVTQIKRDQKVPLIWFVANVGGILGLTMGCSLVTVFEILHHVFLIFFKTGAKSISTVKKTICKKGNYPVSSKAFHDEAGDNVSSRDDGVEGEENNKSVSNDVFVNAETQTSIEEGNKLFRRCMEKGKVNNNHRVINFRLSETSS